MKRTLTTVAALGAAAAMALPAIPASAAVKPGQACKKLNEVKDGLTCVAKGKKRVYEAAAPATTAAPAASSGGAATPAAAPAGLASVPGFDGKTITIGYLGNVSVNTQFPASVNFADGGKALTAGFNSYINRINAQGGIAGKYKIKTNFQETYYTPSEAVKKYAEIKNNVVMFGQLYGTPLAQTLDKPLGEDNMVASAISLDAAWVTNPSFLPVGTTYQGQAINILDWYNKEGGGAGKTYCSLSIANNPYGDAGEQGFDFAASKLGLKVGGKFKTATAAAHSQQLKAAKCDVVMATISGEAQLPPLLSETAKLDYFPTILGVSPSFASRAVVPANSVQMAKQVLIASDGPQWGDERDPGMKLHMADLKKYAPEQIGNPNPATQWGSAQAQSVVALLTKAVELGDLSKAGIKKALSSLGKVKLEGYPEWDYTTPAGRLAPASNYIYKVDISVRGGLDLIKPWASATAAAYK